MRNGNDLNLVFSNSIDDVKRIFEQHEATTPTPSERIPFRSFDDARNGVVDFSLEASGCRHASIAIPLTVFQQLAPGRRMKTNVHRLCG